MVTFNRPDGLQDYSHGEINRTSITDLYNTFITGRFKVTFSRVTKTAKTEDENVFVNLIQTENEADLINTWGQILGAIRPHITVTFNGTSFDKPFLFRAGAKYGIHLPNIFSPMSPKCKMMSTAKFNTALHNWKQRYPQQPYKSNGFIDNRCLELRHDSFLPGIHQDLYDYCKMSLDHAAEKHRVSLGKMKSVSYAEIPRLFHSKNPKLIEYNVQDTEVTTELYFKLIFVTKIFYEELEKSTGCPKESSASNNKSTPAKTMSYLANERNCFVTEFGSHVKKVRVVEVMDEINRYFFGGIKSFKHDLTAQLIREYHSGGIPLRTDWKAFKNIILECKTTVDAQLVFNDASRGGYYDTLKHLICVSFIRHAGHTIPLNGKYKELMRTYIDYFDFKVSPSKREKLISEECEKLHEFIYFLVITYGSHLSLNQKSELLWESYLDFKTYTYVPALQYFYANYLTSGENISKILYDVVLESSRLYFSENKKTSSDSEFAEHLSSLIESKSHRTKFEEKAASFDGSFISKPIQQFTVNQPVFVVDILSSYPNNTIKHNISPHTMVNYTFVAKYNLKEGIHFNAINAKRSDDYVHYTKYVESNDIDYLNTFYGFFLTNDIAPSPFIKEYEHLLNARVIIKRSIATASTKAEELDRKNQSNTLKIEMNACYGNMGLTFSNYTILAYVTASARRSILNANRLINRIYDNDTLRVAYNDTDSAFIQFIKPIEEINKMTIGELTDFFRGTGDVKLPVTEEFVTKALLCKVCYDKNASTKLKPCGHIVLCTDCNTNKCPRCTTSVTATERIDMTNCIKVCCMIELVFSEYLIPVLNECNGKQGRTIEFELEKVMVPYAQYTMKKYIGFQPLECNTISTGTALARKSSSGVQKEIMLIFLEAFRFGKDITTILLFLYHQIGRKLILPLIDKTIDLKLVSKMVTHNQCKNQTNKAINMIRRMRDEGLETPETLKCREIYVEPIGDDKEWSCVTVEQFEKNPDKYELNIIKILEEAMKEVLSYLCIFSVDEAVWFEALCAGKYDPELSEFRSGKHPYYVPPKIKKLNNVIELPPQEYVSHLKEVLEKRAFQKSKVLPASFSVKTNRETKKRKLYDDDDGKKEEDSCGEWSSPMKKKQKTTDFILTSLVVHMKAEDVAQWIREESNRVYLGPVIENMEDNHCHPLRSPFIAKNFSELYSCAMKYKIFLNDPANSAEIRKLRGKTIGCSCSFKGIYCFCEILGKKLMNDYSSFTVIRSIPGSDDDVGTICLDVDCISMRGVNDNEKMSIMYPYNRRVSSSHNNIADEKYRGTPGNISFIEPNTFWLFTRWDTGVNKSMPRRLVDTYKDTIENRKSWLMKCLTKLGNDARCNDKVLFICSNVLDQTIVKDFSKRYCKNVTMAIK